MIRNLRTTTAVSVALLALATSGCGGGDPQAAADLPAAASTPATSADAPSAAVDVCALLTDKEVLAATKAKKLVGPASPAKVGGFPQCSWAPLIGQDALPITVAYLPKNPDNITSGMGDLPAEKGVGEHVRERAEKRDLFLEVLNGDHYLSVSLDDNAELAADHPALARTLLKAAFARLH